MSRGCHRFSSKWFWPGTHSMVILRWENQKLSRTAEWGCSLIPARSDTGCWQYRQLYIRGKMESPCSDSAWQFTSSIVFVVLKISVGKFINDFMVVTWPGDQLSRGLINSAWQKSARLSGLNSYPLKDTFPPFTIFLLFHERNQLNEILVAFPFKAVGYCWLSLRITFGHT